MCFDEIPALDSCKNIEGSMGELCIRCNKCGRFNNEKDNVNTDENIYTKKNKNEKIIY